MATDADLQIVTALERRVLARALAASDFGGLHLRFSIDVVAKYRAHAAGKLIRTRSVGRISMPQWTLDMGIANDDSEVEVVAKDLLERVPAEEHAHWVEHLVVQPASSRFLQMMIMPGACIDDGEPEAWT
ncbi:MAG: hypothetical protein DWI48_01615 [Chloroflexi bacterium]|nr:MAG: hypothetical protein DWI48_01615 [Chloroflexota bacterium]